MKNYTIEMHVSHKPEIKSVTVYVSNMKANDGIGVVIDIYSFSCWSHALAHFGMFLAFADATIYVR